MKNVVLKEKLQQKYEAIQQVGKRQAAVLYYSVQTYLTNHEGWGLSHGNYFPLTFK